MHKHFKITIFLFLSLSFQLVSAQLYLGPKVGMNAFLEPSGFFDSDGSVAFAPGLAMRYQITEKLGIQVEALYEYYSIKNYPTSLPCCGSTPLYWQPGRSIEQKQGVALPVFVFWKFGKRRVRTYLLVGPQIGYVSDVNYSLYDADPDERVFENDYSSFNWVAVGGVGMSVDLGIGALDLNMRIGGGANTAISNGSQSGGMFFHMGGGYLFQVTK